MKLLAELLNLNENDGTTDSAIDGDVSSREVGHLVLRDGNKSLTLTGRGDNYKKAKRIAGLANYGKKEANDIRDDTTGQHGQNYSSMNYRR